MRRLLITLLAIVTILTVAYTGSALAAHEPTLAVFDTLPLNQQLEMIDQMRPEPPIVVPVQYVSPGRAVPSPKTQLPPVQVETLIRTYFTEADVAWAIRISWCESRWTVEATHPSSGAAGLFQHLPRFWADRSSRAGWAGADVYDPNANVAVAAWLFYAPDGGPSHWVCK